ncbi:unnamed protein product [Lampetra fluviatilis]
MGGESEEPKAPGYEVKAGDLRRLSARFHKLDLDSSGALSADEFLSLPELQNNPLVRRVVDILDSDGDGEVDLAEFIEGISRFTINGTKEEKLKFAFQIYDVDRDGFITNGELFGVLKTMVGRNLRDPQLQQIVDKSIISADADGDGKVSFPEFCTMIGDLDFHSKMLVEI